MIVENPSVSIGQAKAIELWPMIGPEVIHQASSFERGKPRVFVEV
jgi:hypothetical protein